MRKTGRQAHAGGWVADAFGNALGNSIVGAIQQGQEDRKVEDALKQAGINPDDANDPRRSQALLDTTRGLVQKGYTPDQIAQLIGNESIQQQLGRIDGANTAISSYSEDDVARLRGEKSSPMPSQMPTYDSDGVMGITVYGDPTIAAGSGFAENVLRPVMDAAAAFGNFAAEHETLALMAGTATQIALQGPAAFVKNTLVDMVVGRTIGEYSRQIGDYIHDQAAGFIERTWGFDADESSFLAHGVAFAGQVVLDSPKNIVGGAKNISNIVRDERGRFKPDPLNPAQVRGTKGTHGNTAGTQPTSLYEKYDADDNFMKHGVTQDVKTRYSKRELNGGYLIETQRGPRNEMLKIERDLVETSPGPENLERWAGKRKGGN